MANRSSMPIYISDDVLKSHEQDTFGHEHIADAVVESIVDTTPPFIVGLFGGWGTGKSSLLELIKEKLDANSIKSVLIDSWRYSSAENLQRAFLVHIAQKIAPKKLVSLRRRLYTSEQETIPFKAADFERLTKVGKEQLWSALWTFVWTTALLFVLIGALMFLPDILNKVPLRDLDWIDLLDKYIDLAFVPLILAFFNFLKLYIFQRPITVMHERIDADELFSQHFDEVVESALKGRVKRNRKLVVFVDNLDRLTEEKMLKALESLKTYISNESCVFVVACDDRVVRDAINRKMEKDSGGKEGNSHAGEHYLDKFFQQTFRLPEFMRVNLYEFGVETFQATRLCSEFQEKGIDIRHLISILLPTDVASPRKVKRLLNEFIATYQIAQRREGAQKGRLPAGAITGRPQFLAKFTTIRAEFPEFYELLVFDTTLLLRATSNAQSGDSEYPEGISHPHAHSESLTNYLRKTQTIMVPDLEPFIWLSQDQTALGLRPEHSVQLRSSLADANFEAMEKLLTESEDEEYRHRAIQFAANLVEFSLQGIEKQNGSRVLTRLLPDMDGRLQKQVAHVVLKSIPDSSLESFHANEILNILRWAEAGVDTQRELLFQRFIAMLRNPGTRRDTFSGALSNIDVISHHRKLLEIQAWLASLLSLEPHSYSAETIEAAEGEETPGGISEGELQSQLVEFGDWLIDEIENYSDNEVVLKNIYIDTFLGYIVARVLGTIEGFDAVALDSDDGKRFSGAITILASQVINGASQEVFLSSIAEILQESGYQFEVEFCNSLIDEIMPVIPPESVNQLVNSLLQGANTLFRETQEEKETLSQTLSKSLDLISDIKRKHGEGVTISISDPSKKAFQELIAVHGQIDAICEFVRGYIGEFGNEDAHVFLISLVEGLFSPDVSSEQNLKLFNTLMELEKSLPTSQIKALLKKIDRKLETATTEDLEIITNSIGQFSNLQSFRQELVEYAAKWLLLLRVEELDLFRGKLALVTTLVDNDALSSNAVLPHLISIFPYGGPPQLELVFNWLQSHAKELEISSGKALIELVLSRTNELEAMPQILADALLLIGNWITEAEVEKQNAYFTMLKSKLQSDPALYLNILGQLWNVFPISQMEPVLNDIYLGGNQDTEYWDLVQRETSSALNIIPESERFDIVMNVWNTLNASNPARADEFINVAKLQLSLKEITELRRRVIEDVRQHETTAEGILGAEINLRLLAGIVRDDTREIMPVVDLFSNLLGRGAEDINLALDHIHSCLEPMGIRWEHKGKLAEALNQAAERVGDDVLIDRIQECGERLKLMWFDVRKYKTGQPSDADNKDPDEGGGDQGG